MSNRTALRHTRKAAAAMIVAVAALGLTACQDNEADTSSSPSSPSASAPQSPTAKTPDDSANTTPSGTPKKSDGRCTDQINYAGDPRSNAEINTIGEETGHCPKPQKAETPSGTPSGTPKKPGVSCTNQINYAGDPRPNAEINTIGEKTGYCPPVQHQ
ncbi:hypothetical protein QFW82_24425 [Streptomyces malaysiensis subsp. malaysiensis]|uniref:hypothetical protein n=1 Tax=Streptomyces malaysiensis TaxID=92644 RepID=UPI0024C08D87|nr:hypothetical protein [Streptomyces sp. NA07423]WHX19972.1 hypothetical protein QFW82_24425 [Streptomyces sp. NA07423]